MGVCHKKQFKGKTYDDYDDVLNRANKSDIIESILSNKTKAGQAAARKLAKLLTEANAKRAEQRKARRKQRKAEAAKKPKDAKEDEQKREGDQESSGQGQVEQEKQPDTQPQEEAFKDEPLPLAGEVDLRNFVDQPETKEQYVAALAEIFKGVPNEQGKALTADRAEAAANRTYDILESIGAYWAEKGKAKSAEDYLQKRLAGIGRLSDSQVDKISEKVGVLKSTGKPTKRNKKGKAVTIRTKYGGNIVAALEGATAESVVHELFHVFEQDLTPEQRKVIVSSYNTTFPDVKTDVFDRDVAEYGARLWTEYFREGKNPRNNRVKQILDLFTGWLDAVVKGSVKHKNNPVVMTDDVRAMFDDIAGNLEPEKLARRLNNEFNKELDKQVEAIRNRKDRKKETDGVAAINSLRESYGLGPIGQPIPKSLEDAIQEGERLYRTVSEALQYAREVIASNGEATITRAGTLALDEHIKKVKEDIEYLKGDSSNAAIETVVELRAALETLTLASSISGTFSAQTLAYRRVQEELKYDPEVRIKNFEESYKAKLSDADRSNLIKVGKRLNEARRKFFSAVEQRKDSIFKTLKQEAQEAINEIVSSGPRASYDVAYDGYDLTDNSFYQSVYDKAAEFVGTEKTVDGLIKKLQATPEFRGYTEDVLMKGLAYAGPKGRQRIQSRIKRAQKALAAERSALKKLQELSSIVGRPGAIRRIAKFHSQAVQSSIEQFDSEADKFRLQQQLLNLMELAHGNKRRKREGTDADQAQYKAAIDRIIADRKPIQDQIAADLRQGLVKGVKIFDIPASPDIVIGTEKYKKLQKEYLDANEAVTASEYDAAVKLRAQKLSKALPDSVSKAVAIILEDKADIFRSAITMADMSAVFTIGGFHTLTEGVLGTGELLIGRPERLKKLARGLKIASIAMVDGLANPEIRQKLGLPENTVEGVDKYIEYAKQHYLEILQDKFYIDFVQPTGLSIVQPGGFQDSSQFFGSRIFERMYGGPDANIVRRKAGGFALGLKLASEASFNVYANTIRMQRFKEEVLRRGLTDPNSETQQKEREELAEYINIVTGTTNINSKALAATGALIFAPKYYVSRIQHIGKMLGSLASVRFLNAGRTLASGGSLKDTANALAPKDQVKRLALKDAAKFLASWGTLAGLASIFGAEIEDDPRKSSFLRIRTDNGDIDIPGGYGQYVRLATQLMVKLSRTKSSKVSNQYFDTQTNSRDLISRFTMGKLHPAFSYGFAVIDGEDFIGKPVGASPGGALLSYLGMNTPLLFQEMYPELVKSGGPLDAFKDRTDTEFSFGDMFAATTFSGVGLSVLDFDNTLKTKKVQDYTDSIDYRTPSITGIPDWIKDNEYHKYMFRQEFQNRVGTYIKEQLESGNKPSKKKIQAMARKIKKQAIADWEKEMR